MQARGNKIKDMSKKLDGILYRLFEVKENSNAGLV
jgi:hypothetical protein